MSKFVKRVEQVEAVRFRGLTAWGEPIFDERRPQWLAVALERDRSERGSVTVLREDWKPGLAVFGSGGVCFCGAGNWIVRGLEGSLTVMSSEAFAARYEALPEPFEELAA
ncbi:hypothetical protein AAG598_03165 [Citromicrobium bathyomarinum]